jgi:HEAT repeat protein
MTIALRDIRGDAAATALGRLLRSDPDPLTRVMAATALTHFETASRIASLEGGLRDAMPAVRSAAAWSLEEVGGRQSVAALLAALARESDPDAGKAIVRALGATGDPAAVDGLVGALGAEASQIRESAAHVLGALGDVRAVPALMVATRDPDHEVRLTAVWALDALQQGR